MVGNRIEGGLSKPFVAEMIPKEHQVLNMKLEDLMFARFSLICPYFGKSMLPVCCCMLEACNFFFACTHN